MRVRGRVRGLGLGLGLEARAGARAGSPSELSAPRGEGGRWWAEGGRALVVGRGRRSLVVSEGGAWAVLTRSRATGVLSSSSRPRETWPLVYRSMQSGGTVNSRP